MKALQGPARVAAVVGAVAAVGAGTVFVVGTASAAEPAKCVDNVNVREEPRIDSRVIALCEAGTVVEAGEVRNGFVKLTDLGGWSAQEYVSINGQKPVKPSTGRDTGGATKTEDGETPSSSRGRGSGSGNDDSATTGSSRDATGTEDSTATKGAEDSTAKTTDEDADAADGKRSESRTNGQKDAKDTKSGDAASGAQSAPKPAAPGGGLLPAL
ncbi:MAG: hypothetical protein AB7V44_21795 [Pseudonocardia sp.]